ncbi:MAG: hypothetical protein NWF09_09485 [Candidatus Bathyarchaeota archaeon]|nr:hypothetical protein [Candidatus Bathyarchaeota archaeon]
MDGITAKITGIKYKPLLCAKLKLFNIKSLDKALSTTSAFILNVSDGCLFNNSQIAVSWWVSAKRTRSYPYARVYDTLGFSGRKVTIIPIVKDEGADGDRDFLQWDTVSLMSLLGIYVVIGYYSDAEKNKKYENKITNQRYDIKYLENEIRELLTYQSDALHWNLSRLEKAGEIGKKAIDAYEEISKKLKVKMHSLDSAKDWFEELRKNKDTFLNLSRVSAEKAQKRESVTVQPKELLEEGDKTTITITNYLGGKYFFTCDEAKIQGNELHLIEGKHTREKKLPSLNDIKDGLIKMILFTNLVEVKVGNQEYNAIPILKLTTGHTTKVDSFISKEKAILNSLMQESKKNNFRVLLNGEYLDSIQSLR